MLVWATAAAAQNPRIKIILDTDIGTDIDDAWALGFAMTAPEFELLAVTITDGNTPARARVACKLLHTANRDAVPVAVGRPTPPPEGIDYQFTWADDFTAKRPVTQPAAQLIVDTARRFPNEVTLIAVGPLQNVADALRLEPRLPTAPQARRADERLDPVLVLEPGASARVERRTRDRRRTTRLRGRLRADDRAAGLDILRAAEGGGTGAPACPGQLRSPAHSKRSIGSGWTLRRAA